LGKLKTGRGVLVEKVSFADEKKKRRIFEGKIEPLQKKGGGKRGTKTVLLGRLSKGKCVPIDQRDHKPF